MVEETEKKDKDEYVEKDSELDLLAEQELQRLARQFRVMEGDKEAYIDEVTKALKRQRKLIHELKAIKAHVARQLRVQKSKQNRKKDAENRAKIGKLAEEQDTLTILIKQEIQILKRLEEELDKVRRQIFQKHKEANAPKEVSIHKGPGGGPVVRDKREIGKRIVLLENRLDGAMVG